MYTRVFNNTLHYADNYARVLSDLLDVPFTRPRTSSSSLTPVLLNTIYREYRTRKTTVPTFVKSDLKSFIFLAKQFFRFTSH